ncbi:MAG: N-acetylmuramoyl-L-alanine amidase [Pseudomonadota bacterium]
MPKLPTLITIAILSGLARPAHATKICLDPGHGGSDPGALGCNLREASINLDTQLRLRTLLQGAGLSVIMTRETDVSVGLSARAEYANARAANRFVSIHSNSASSSSATGIETFCATNGSSNSFDMRNKIQSEMVATWPLANRGGKTANFTVLTATSMPATLSELGFIVNCSADATYLGSPAQRQRAAEAHLHAIQRHLGLSVSTPSAPPPASPPPAPSTGDAKGVVFVDHGSGTADMSERLPGASVTITETSAQVAASATDAAWSFALAPATYHVRASKSGYQTAERTCTVAAGATEWCSLGLVADPPPATPPLPGSPPPATDAGSPSTDATPAAPPVEETDAGASPDVEGGQDLAATLWPDPSMVPFSGPREEEHSEGPEVIALGQGMGCSNLTAPGGSTWLVLSVLALGLLQRTTRRRRVSSLLAAVSVVALASPSFAVDKAASGLPSARLVHPRLILDGEVTAPVLSPRGDQIAFTTDNLRGLYLVDTSAGTVTTVSTRERAGYHPEWTADGSAIALRLADRPHAAEPLELVSPQGRFRGPLTLHPTRQAVAREDSVWLFEDKHEILVAADDDKYFAPLLSPDGQHLVYSGISTGLFVLRIADGYRVSLGQGSHARFSQDGRWLVFDRSEDDGQRLTGSDLHRTDLRHPRYRTENLTRTPGLIEQFPSLSADGRTLAFVVDGQLWIAEIQQAR